MKPAGSIVTAENVALIQVFRGIAALAVTLHHSAHRVQGLPDVVGAVQPFWLGRLLNMEVGAVGVDLFFVISGFIMTYTTPRATGPRPGSFLWRRFIRIYPLYWICSFVALAFLASRWVQGLKYGPLAITQSLLLYPTLYLDSVRPVLLPQGWTLIYELVFYLLFAATLRWSRPRQTLLVLGLLGTLFGAARLLPVGHELRVLLGDQILFEFVLGMLLGVLFCEYRTTLTPRAAFAATALGLALLAPSAFIPAYDWSVPRLLKFGLPAFLIIGGLLLHPSQARWPMPRSLRFLGDASYSLYLVHTIVLLAFTTAFSRLPLLGRLPPDLYFLLLGATCVAAGTACYFLVERPLLRFLRSTFPRTRPAVLAPSAP